jgi:Antitoxin VbhA
MPSEQEINHNLRVVENAIAQQRLEGLEPSSILVADLERVARGEISVQEVIKNLNQRFPHARVR